MKSFLIFSAIVAVCSSKSVNLLKRSQLSDELLNDPRYLVYENSEGLFEVEDLHAQPANLSLTSIRNDVTFYIFTPETPVTGIQVTANQLHDLINMTGFDIQRHTLVVIHGWKNHYESPVNDYIKNAVLSQRNVNVIVVDWSPIAAKNYITAQGQVLNVGNFVGDFLLRLDDELNHCLTRVTIVGHSLGAHIAGNAGARTKGLISVIVGLDAAGPLFSERNINNRLDPTDAPYVHAIHTNDGKLGFGIKLGKVDYYPNGGRSQPGCGWDITGSCAHGRAYEYYAESLTNNNFVSSLCSSIKDYNEDRYGHPELSLMGGYPIDNASEGRYCLTTNAQSPYAQGKKN